MGEVKRNLINKDIIKISLVLAVIFALSIIFIIVFGRVKVPKETIIFDNTLKTLTLDSFESKSKIELIQLEVDNHNPDVDLMLDMIRDIEIEYIHKYNKASREIEGILKVYLRDVPLLEGQVYINNHYLAFDMPVLYHQPIYMTWEDFSKEYGINKDQLQLVSGNIKEKLNRKNYESFTEIEAQVYVDIIRDFIKNTMTNTNKERIQLGGKEISCKAYSFSVDDETIGLYANHLIKAILNDQKLSRIMDQQGLYFLFNTNSYNEFVKKYPYDSISDLKLYFDNHDLLRKASITIDAETESILDSKVSGQLFIDTEYTKLENISFKGIEINQAINVSQLSDKKRDELNTQFYNNFVEFFENKNLSDLIILD